MDAVQIREAIGAHGLWKARLVRAIASGGQDLDPDLLATDNQCAFGRWLYALPAAERESPTWVCVRELHRTFHLEGALALRQALDGHTNVAQEMVAKGGSCAQASLELIQAMLELVETRAA